MSDQTRPIRPDCKEEFIEITHAIEKHTEAANRRTEILEEHTKTINAMSNKIFNGFGDQIQSIEKRLDRVDSRVWAILFSVFGALASSVATLIFFLIRSNIIGG